MTSRARELVAQLEALRASFGATAARHKTALLSALAREGAALPPRVVRLGIDEVPASGQPAEVLSHHGLDSASLKDRIRQELKG